MAKNNQSSGSLMSDRDKRMLYLLAALLLIAGAYFLGFQKMKEKQTEVETESATLQQDVAKLKTKVAKKESVEADTKAKEAGIQKILEQFPVEVRTQDAIYQLDQMEKKIKNLNIISEGFTMNQIFFYRGVLVTDETPQAEATPAPSGTPAEQAAQVEEEQQKQQSTKSGDYIGYRSDIAVNFLCDYKGLKQVIEFIRTNEEKMTISDISIAKENGNKPLKCTMTVSMYSISGRDEEYRSPNITGIGQNKSNIFMNK